MTAEYKFYLGAGYATDVGFYRQPVMNYINFYLPTV